MPVRKDQTPWTPAEVSYLRQRSREGASHIIVADELNAKFHAGKSVRAPTAVQNKRTRERIHVIPTVTVKPLEAATPEGVPVDPVVLEQQRQERIATLREERQAILAIAGERSLRAKLEQLVQDTAKRFPPPPAYKPPSPRSTSKVSRETMVQMWSDWHAGENVSAEGTRGFNEYSDRIFQERVERVVESHLSIKHRLEAGGGYQFERCVIAANGDFVSGTIHELEKHSDHENIVWAVYETGLVMAKAIRDLAAVYPSVEVFCTAGNHGRLPDARRIQQKEPTRSWDTLCYLFARENLRNVQNVTFYIPNSYSVAYDIYGWRWLQTHGHDVKSWNSIPWYGLNRLVGNLNALEAGRGSPIHYWAFGHFHNASSLPHASGESFVNGSLIGANEFALNALGKADRPTQWLLQVHAEHGVTGRWPLFAAPPLSVR